MRKIPYEKSLEYCNPELAKKWHPLKNGDLKPCEVTKSSEKIVWWKCEYDHNWQQQIASIVRHKSKCPVCMGRKLMVGVNDIITVRKDLALEWNFDKNNGLMPDMVKYNSNIKVWWKCKKGHEWEATVFSRTLNNNGCPYCAGFYPIEGENDLSTVFPDIAKEWNYEKNELTPEKYKPFSNKKVWWKCKKGHEWETRICERTRGTNCPYCSGRKVTEEDSIQMLYPELIKEWDFEKNKDISPADYSPRSEKKVHWVCAEGHKWVASISNRVGNKSGCPYCCGNLAIPGVTDLKTKCPELMEEWNYERNYRTNPEKITFRSNKKVWWKCKQGHEWRSTPHIRSNGCGCPYCHKNKS